MRRILAGLAVFSISAGAQAQGVTDLFRSVTNALQGSRAEAPQQQGATAVFGVRGMDQAEQAAAPAAPANDDYVMMEGWAAAPPEAEAQAAKKGLVKRAAALKAETSGSDAK